MAAVRCLLDTNVFIAAMRGHPAVRSRLHDTALSSLVLSPVVLGELWVGVRKSTRPQANARLLQAVAGQIEVAPLDAAAAERYADLRAELERQGQPIGANDMWIAAQCLALNAVLVTDNTAEFSRVQGLVVENWLRG